MDGEKILWAILIGIMIFTLWPQTKAMIQNSRKAQPGDWSAAILPLLLVAGFVALLIMLVK
jgi:hypothetical protein